MGRKKVHALVFIFLISLFITLMQLDSYRKGRVNFIESGTSTALLPAQNFFTSLGKRFSGLWRSLTSVTNLEEENKRLTAHIYALKEEQDKFRRVVEENRILRELLDISRSAPGKIIPAGVSARDPDNWFQSIQLDKGYKNGISRDMAVISNQGLVGRVVAVSPHTCRVRLIFDEKSGVPGQVVSSGTLGVVYGEGKDTCIMKYIQADAPVNVGDKVITSNMGRIFPPEKAIGTVTKIYGRDNLLYKAVQIKPAVRFDSLEYVLLIEKK